VDVGFFLAMAVVMRLIMMMGVNVILWPFAQQAKILEETLEQ
jgi:hypothetical protein